MPIDSLGMKLAKRIFMRKAKVPVARNTAMASSLHRARARRRPESGEERLILVVSPRSGQPDYLAMACRNAL